VHGQEPGPAGSGLRRRLAPLRGRNYLLFWIGFATSNTGRWIELTGALWLVSELTDSPALLGLVGIVRAVPALLLSPVAGVIVDRVDQRRMLFATQAISMALSLALGILVLTGHLALWHLYVQLAIQSAIQAFDAGVRQALFPRLVPRDQLGDAVTLTITAGRSAKFIGPVLGGVAIAQLGLASPFLVNSASFLVLMGAVAAMRAIPATASSEKQGFRGELAEGVRYLWRSPVLRGLLLVEIVFGILQMNEVMVTIIARDVLFAGPEGLGLLLSAAALGSILGLVTLISVGQSRHQGRFVVWSIAAYVVGLLAVAATPGFALTFVALTALGLLDSLVTVTRHSIMQMTAPGEMRGRVMANMGTVTNGVSPLAQAQSGALAAAVGASRAVAISAAVLGMATFVIVRSNRSLRTYRGDPGGSMDSPNAVGDVRTAATRGAGEAGSR
jgi:MFS family permease